MSRNSRLKRSKKKKKGPGPGDRPSRKGVSLEQDESIYKRTDVIDEPIKPLTTKEVPVAPVRRLSRRGS